MPKAIHLTTTVRVIQGHIGQRRIRAEAAAEIVKELSLRLNRGESGSADLVLADKLKRATGCAIAELAVYADDWSA